MEYEQWWNARKRKAATIILTFILAALLVAAILRHWLPTSTLYLFLRDLFRQILFYVGSVLALLEWLMVKFLETPLEKKLFTTLVLGCLFIASYQAWIDEHNNTQEVIVSKEEIAKEKDFWKGQSYAKDESLRTLTGLLAQNFNTLSGTQNSLTKLSDKILDISKPAPRKIHSIDLGPTANDDRAKARRKEQFVLLVNEMITPVHMLVTCDQPIVSAAGDILGSRGIMSSDIWSGATSDRSYRVGAGSGVWGPETPLVVTVYFNDGELRTCKFDEQ